MRRVRSAFRPHSSHDSIGIGAYGTRKFDNKSAASAASLNYVKFQAVIKSAARAASSGGRASGRLEHGFLFAILGRASGLKIVETSYT